MIDETKGAADVRAQIEAVVVGFKARAAERAEARQQAAMEAGVYLPATQPAPVVWRSSAAAADWRARQAQPWPSGNADRFQGRAVYGIGWRS